MGANSEVLERADPAIQPTASGHIAQRQREQQELLDFALHEMTSDWFYDIELNGAEIEGVGIQGAMELASFRAEQGYPIRLTNGVEIIEVERHGALGVQATVVAREGRTFREGLGVCFFPYFIAVEEAGEKKLVEDPRADRKALSIAKRNAILDLIPDIVVQSILDNRSTAVPRNEERKANQVLAARNRTAVPARTATEADKNLGPYDEPSRLPPLPRTPAPASTRQIVRLLQLAQHPSVSEQVRASIKAKLDTDVSYDLAAEWIPILEAQIKERD